jgi:hypothetical protein
VGESGVSLTFTVDHCVTTYFGIGPFVGIRTPIGVSGVFGYGLTPGFGANVRMVGSCL